MKKALLSLALATSQIIPISMVWYVEQTDMVARYESGEIESTLRARHNDYDRAWQGRNNQTESRYIAPVRRLVEAYKCAKGEENYCENRFQW